MISVFSGYLIIGITAAVAFLALCYRIRRDKRHSKAKDVSVPKHFFGYLSPADAPVVPGLEQFEIVYAKNQPEYLPLRTLRSRTDDGRVMSRWSLTPEQRQAVANGADVYLTLMTFHHPLQPITIAVATDINPDFIRHEFSLDSTEVEYGWVKIAEGLAEKEAQSRKM